MRQKRNSFLSVCSGKKPAITLESYKYYIKRRLEHRDKKLNLGAHTGECAGKPEKPSFEDGLLSFRGRWPRGAEVGVGWAPDRAINTHRRPGGDREDCLLEEIKQVRKPRLELAFYCHTFYDFPLSVTPGTFCSIYQGLTPCLHIPRGLRR